MKLPAAVWGSSLLVSWRAGRGFRRGGRCGALGGATQGLQSHSYSASSTIFQVHLMVLLPVGTSPESETAMASSSGARFEIHDDDGGHKSIVRAAHPKSAGPECTDRAKQNPAMADEDDLPTRSVSPCCSGAESPPKRSWYYSARIQRMIDGGELQSENATSRTESEIEASKVHWSEVVETTTMSETEQSGKTNRECFEVLERRRYVREGKQIVFKQISKHKAVLSPSLFREYWGENLVVGEKLAEGGQAEIYNATSHGGGCPVVLKVFKGGSVLQHLEKQIPPALLRYHETFHVQDHMPLGLGATLLTDERFKDRFAFVMRRCWGDLRKLIDQQIMYSSLNAGPPFSTKQVLHLMLRIALDMRSLHEQHPPILHNDLKSANVLVRRECYRAFPLENSIGPLQTVDGFYDIIVADYECSVGVVGTGLWRAPETLQQLKDRVPMSDLKFSEKCDVYSYGMTCYELVAGRIPFEDYTSRCREGCELVLRGDRPELPPDLDPFVEGIITSC